jgi:hypothetical protein
MRACKFDYLWVLQGNYGHGWEDLTAEETWREIRARKREYVENEGGRYRIIRRRELRAAVTA